MAVGRSATSGIPLVRLGLAAAVAAGVAIWAWHTPARAAPPASPGVQAPAPLRVAVPVAAINFLPIFVGQARGYFLEEGIQLDIVQMNPPLSVPALLNDEVQLNGASSVVLRAAVQGAPLRILLFDLERYSSFLVARPEIQAIADLRGRRVGAGAPGTASDTAARLALRTAGLEVPRDVELVPLPEGGPALFAALEQDQVQAVVLPAGDNVRARHQGYRELLYLGELLEAPYSGWGVTTAKLQSDRPLLQRWVRAQLRSLIATRDDPAGAAEVAAGQFNLAPDDALAATQAQVRAISRTRPGYATPEALARLLTFDILPPLGLTESPVPIDQLVDFSLLEEARAELGSGSGRLGQDPAVAERR
ncbi:MAG: ABC transporter substrate-binding protein [Chloroflexi bacterium]|nr:ABC transporter substrate-binding protein [Chloroflexota bacterium]